MKIVFMFLVSALIFLGCSENEKTAKQHVEKNEPKELTKTEKVEEVKQESVEQEVQEEPQLDTIEKVVATVEEKVEEVESKVLSEENKDKLTRLKDKVVAVIPNDIDEVEIYNGRCAGCHGHNGEKKALGKSEVISKWTAKKIEETLHGYKDGTYGGPLKAMMKSQASKLSNEEIEALSKYISNL